MQVSGFFSQVFLCSMQERCPQWVLAVSMNSAGFSSTLTRKPEVSSQNIHFGSSTEDLRLWHMKHSHLLWFEGSLGCNWVETEGKMSRRHCGWIFEEQEQQRRGSASSVRGREHMEHIDLSLRGSDCILDGVRGKQGNRINGIFWEILRF